MKRIDLLLLLSKVDGKYLAEADEHTSESEKDDEDEIIVTGVEVVNKPYKRKRAASIAAAAASLCILSGVTIGLANSPFWEPSNSLSENADSSEANNTEHEQLQTQQITVENSEPSSVGSSENATESSSIEVTNNADKPLEIPYSEVPETAKLGERFCVIPPVDGGHLYVTLNKCEVFGSLNDAGIEYDDLNNHYYIKEFCSNEETTELINGFKMIKIHMTIENVDATSYDHIYLPDEYGKYDFDVSTVGFVDHSSREYFDLSPTERTKYNYFLLHLEPGEKKDIVLGYFLDTRQRAIEDAYFLTGYEEENMNPGIPYTKVDLELKGG